MTHGTGSSENGEKELNGVPVPKGSAGKLGRAVMLVMEAWEDKTVNDAILGWDGEGQFEKLTTGLAAVPLPVKKTDDFERQHGCGRGHLTYWSLTPLIESKNGKGGTTIQVGV